MRQKHSRRIFFIALFCALLLAVGLVVPVYAQSTLPRYAGLGAAPANPRIALQPQISCDIDPIQLTCIETGIANWIATGLVSAFQPITDWIAHDPADIFFFTSPDLTYGNPVVKDAYTWVLGVSDGVLVIYLILAGYNIMRRGSHFHANMEALPTLALATVAAHFALFFIGPIIEVNNAMCDALRNFISINLLTNYLTGLFQGNLIDSGLILFILTLIFAGLALAVAGEMIIRIAFIDLLIMFASAWTMAWGVPQTQVYARACTRAFFIAVFIQVVQLATIGLGGVLFTAFSRVQFVVPGVATPLIQTFIGIAALTLTLRMPRLLGAIVPMQEASEAILSLPGQAGQALYQVAKVAIALA